MNPEWIFTGLGVYFWLAGWRAYRSSKIKLNERNEWVEAPQWVCIICGQPQAKGILEARATVTQLWGAFMIAYATLHLLILRYYIPAQFDGLSYALVGALGGYLALKLREWLRKNKPYLPTKTE
jgi:hypothetical protein